MGVEIPVGFAQAAIVYTGAAGTSPFVTTIGVDTSETDGDWVNIANWVFENWAERFDDITAAELTISHVVLSVGALGPGGSVTSTLPPVPGTASGASDVIAMAACVYKLTSSLGRSGRGRQLIPGCLRETNVGFGGTIDTSPASSILARYQGFLDALPAGTDPDPSVSPVLLHSEAVGMAPSPIIGASIRSKVAWVRGRLF